MSPWTRRQVRYLESSGSPLTSAQKSKMNSELHSDPSLGHKKKGSAAMAKESKNESPASQTMSGMRLKINKGAGGKVTGHMITHEFEPKGSPSGAFMERPEDETHMFGPKGEKVGDGMEMMAHLKKHLGIGAAPSPKTEEAEMQPAAHEPQTAEAEEDQEGE
jgi:hypothetical protein